MTNSEDSVSEESYVMSSKYRQHVLDQLSELGEATPQDLADRVEEPRPHISRALSELQEQGIVELRVPESRSVGRYYGLTERGEAVWPSVRDRIQAIEWSVGEPTLEATAAVRSHAREVLGDGLRIVGVFDGSEVRFVHANEAVLVQYDDKAIEDALQTLIFDRSLEAVDVGGESCTAEVLSFDSFTVIHIRVNDQYQLGISFDPDEDVCVPAFISSIRSIFTEARDGSAKSQTRQSGGGEHG